MGFFATRIAVLLSAALVVIAGLTVVYAIFFVPFAVFALSISTCVFFDFGVFRDGHQVSGFWTWCHDGFAVVFVEEVSPVFSVFF